MLKKTYHGMDIGYFHLQRKKSGSHDSVKSITARLRLNNLVVDLALWYNRKVDLAL